MRISVLAVIFLLLSCMAAFTADDREDRIYHHPTGLENAEINIEGTSVIFTGMGEAYYRIEITQDGELFLDDQLIPLKKRERKLLQDYNQQMRKLVDSAKDIGVEAGKLGLKGINLGFSALVMVGEGLWDEKDMAELKNDLEAEKKKIEHQAKQLQKQADYLEDLAEELEELHEEIRNSIPELRELEGF